jgi:hypothetical protein
MAVDMAPMRSRRPAETGLAPSLRSSRGDAQILPGRSPREGLCCGAMRTAIEGEAR